MSDRFRLTLAQLNPTVGDLAGNAAKARAAFEVARAAGADMLVLPEMFITGYQVQDLVLKPAFVADAMAHIVDLSRACADVWSQRVLRAGMGAHFLLDIHDGVEIRELVGRFPGRIVATHLHARQSLYDTDLTGTIGLVFGNEGAGLSRAVLDAAKEIVAIPMPGATESLNIAAAAAVCLFERVRQGTIRTRE